MLDTLITHLNKTIQNTDEQTLNLIILFVVLYSIYSIARILKGK